MIESRWLVITRITNPYLVSRNEVLEEVFVGTDMIQMLEEYPHSFVFMVFRGQSSELNAYKPVENLNCS